MAVDGSEGMPLRMIVFEHFFFLVDDIVVSGKGGSLSDVEIYRHAETLHTRGVPAIRDLPASRPRPKSWEKLGTEERIASIIKRIWNRVGV
jgi:hypothetical protein